MMSNLDAREINSLQAFDSQMEILIIIFLFIR